MDIMPQAARTHLCLPWHYIHKIRQNPPPAQIFPENEKNRHPKRPDNETRSPRPSENSEPQLCAAHSKFHIRHYVTAIGASGRNGRVPDRQRRCRHSGAQ